MSLQNVEAMAGSNVPEANGLVITAAGQEASIRAETDRLNLASVSFTGQERLACGRPPDPDPVILGSSRQEPAVRTEGSGQNGAKGVCKNGFRQVSPTEIDLPHLYPLQVSLPDR